ncbi:GldM family protein [Flavobacterium lindanitolerans]|uniref:GldM family protein n=2 Tax=Flavobacterium TaxID=237 RepID=UPI0012194CC4|nr:GldM family protein [Flavobacterium lindanitolerans]MDQ7959455.1 GldM family protein [Flavobacterium lindanitolerans]THD32956.1 MAG: hypothetical protein DI588_06950 [Flavobacterium johnsoniae]
MKIIIIFLFVVCAAFGQNTKDISSNNVIAVVSADKMNVVYRGIINPISIVVPGAKSFKAKGLGLSETQIPGKYNLVPGAGLEVKITIEIIMPDDTVLVEEKIFRIKNIQRLNVVIDEESCQNCILEFSKEELKDKEIKLGTKGFLFDIDLSKSYIKSFSVVFPNDKSMVVEGNKFDEKVLKEIAKLKKGSIIKLTNIQCSNPLNACFTGVNPARIMIKNN